MLTSNKSPYQNNWYNYLTLVFIKGVGGWGGYTPLQILPCRPKTKKKIT